MTAGWRRWAGLGRWLLLPGLLAGCAPVVYRLQAYEASAGEELEVWGRHLRRVRKGRVGGVPYEFSQRRLGRYYGFGHLTVPGQAGAGTLTLVLKGGRLVPTGLPLAIVPPDSSRLTDDGRYDPPKCLVSWLAVQPDGRILVGGDFHQLQGQARPGLARLLADGRLDPTFVPPPDLQPGAPLLALVRPGGRVLLSVRQGPGPLVLLEADGQPDPAFRLDSLGDAPAALAAWPDGRLLLGYHDPDVPDSLRLRGWLPDGRPDPGFAPPDWTALTDTTPDSRWQPGYLEGVQALAAPPDQHPLVGLGAYSTGAWLLRCHPDGTPERLLPLPPPPGFEPSAGPADAVRIWGIWPQTDGHVVVGQTREYEDFDTYSLLRLAPGGEPARWLVRPRLGSRRQAALVQPDNRILLATSPSLLPWRTRWFFWKGSPIGHNYNTPPSPAERRRLWLRYRRGVWQATRQGRHDARHWLRQLLPDGRPDPGFRPARRPPNGPVYALAVQPDGKVLVGGNFTRYQGHAVPGVLRLRADGSFDDTFRP